VEYTELGEASVSLVHSQPSNTTTTSQSTLRVPAVPRPPAPPPHSQHRRMQRGEQNRAPPAVYAPIAEEDASGDDGDGSDEDASAGYDVGGGEPVYDTSRYDDAGRDIYEDETEAAVMSVSQGPGYCAPAGRDTELDLHSEGHASTRSTPRGLVRASRRDIDAQLPGARLPGSSRGVPRRFRTLPVAMAAFPSRARADSTMLLVGDNDGYCDTDDGALEPAAMPASVHHARRLRRYKTLPSRLASTAAPPPPPHHPVVRPVARYVNSQRPLAPHMGVAEAIASRRVGTPDALQQARIETSAVAEAVAVAPTRVERMAFPPIGPGDVDSTLLRSTQRAYAETQTPDSRSARSRAVTPPAGAYAMRPVHPPPSGCASATSASDDETEEKTMVQSARGRAVYA
jgi:hypothetical protein